jgi:chromatin remodeling complex protein RSC6
MSNKATKKTEVPKKKADPIKPVEVEAEADEDEEELDAEVLEAELEDKVIVKKVEITFDTSIEGFAMLRENNLKIDQLNRDNKTIVKLLEKKISKELKQLKDNKKKKSNPDKPKSGFVKKRDIPQAFLIFYEKCLKKDETFKTAFPDFNTESQLARTDVTKMIYHYIRTNKLYDGDNKRIIIPNKAIKDLFGLKDAENITFSTFQTYTSRLYKDAEADDVDDAEDSNEDIAASDDEEADEVETVIEKKVKSTDKKTTSKSASK